MAGREDFAIIRARLLGDDRAFRAAELYVAAGLAAEATALATVIGHVAMMGLWASRETDDGILAGDGRAALSAALLTPPATTRKALEALVEAGLLRPKTRAGKAVGLYLAGFRDCYRPILEKRKSEAERQRKRRSSLKTYGGTSGGTSAVRTHAPYRTDPDRSEPIQDPPRPLAGGGVPAGLPGTGKGLRPRDRERFERILNYQIMAPRTGPEMRAAICVRRRHSEKPLEDDEIFDLLASPAFTRVTADKLARFAKEP